MRVGCPREIKNHEYRVGLTPGSVREYVSHGHSVIIESGAGAGIGADDGQYQAAGAKIVKTAAEVFTQSDMIVKVKEPQPSEWVQLREGQILYTYLHLAPDPDQTRGLVESGVTAVAYETVTDARGGLPLLAPMSEVAGRLAIQAGATALQKANGGRGILLGGVPGVLPAKVAVIGGGVVGHNAAKMAVGLGAEVTIIDRSIPRLRELDDIYNGRVRTRYSTVEVIEEDGEIRIRVTDDGSGFDPKRAGGGFGLLGMRERVSLTGGRFDIRSSEDGTTINAALPARRL